MRSLLTDGVIIYVQMSRGKNQERKDLKGFLSLPVPIYFDSKEVATFEHAVATPV